MPKNTFIQRLAAAAVALGLIAAVGSAGVSASGGTRTAEIVDPILNMKAYSMTVPSNWIFDGAVIEGSQCVSLPFAVFRAESPDGLTGIKSLPRLDWSWWDGSKSAPKSAADCMPYHRNLSADEVLKYMVGVLKVKYVGNLPTPNRASFQERIASRNSSTLSSEGDQAAASVQYHINKILIDERLDVSVVCSTSSMAIFGRNHTCTAYVTRARAPHGKWSQSTFTPLTSSFATDPQWQAKWTEIMQQHIQDNGRAAIGALQAAGRQRTAANNAFQQAQAMRQQQHEDFLATMQRGTDKSMQAAAASADANHQMAHDWADYALDQQKRLDPNTGEITKDSSAYSYTWVNESGKRIQTNDVNMNPNGNGSGNWTLQENVR